MKKYTVTMRNPKSGKLEAYGTEAKNRAELDTFLELWEDGAGYTIVDVREDAA